MRRLFVLLIAIAPAAFPASARKVQPAPNEVETDKGKVPARFRAPTSEEEVERDAAADKKRDELIDELETIIPKIPEGEKKADLYFQLAELWWEKSRYVSMQEVNDYDDSTAKWLETRKGEEPRINTKQSDAYRKEALKLYQMILKTHPSYERKDDVLFVVAYNLYEAGNQQEAIQSYNTLIKQYPQSKLVPDAYVQMGEHFFVSTDLTRSRAASEKAASFKLPKLYPFAVYKLAWCDYNAGEYQGSIDKFKEVIAYSERQAESPGARDPIQLKSGALKDILLAYAQIYPTDSAPAWLHQKGAARAPDHDNKLAATHF